MLKKNYFWIVVAIGIALELLVFFVLPKQAYIDGLIEAWFIHKGLFIYKDFASQYFPLMFLILVPVHLVFGFTQSPTVWLSPITSIGTLLILAFISRRILKGWQQLLPVLFFLFWNLYIAENHYSVNAFLGVFNLLALFFWLLWYRKPSSLKALLIGIFISISFLSQQMLFLFVGGILLSMIFKSLVFKLGIKDFLISSGVFLFSMLTMIVWLWQNNALADFYFWNIGWYTEGSYTFDKLDRGFNETLIYFAIFSTILILLPVILRKLKLLTNFLDLKTTEIVFFFLILLTFPLTFWFATFHMSREMMALPIFSLALGYGVQQLREQNKKIGGFPYLCLGLIFLLSLGGFLEIMLPKYIGYFQNHPKNIILTEFSKEDQSYQIVQWIKDNTGEEDRLFVLDNSLIYLESNRLLSSSMAISSLPWAMEPLSRLQNEISKSPPDYWVVDTRSWKRYHEWGYDQSVSFFQSILNCDTLVAQFGYTAIYKQDKSKSICFEKI